MNWDVLPFKKVPTTCCRVMLALRFELKLATKSHLIKNVYWWYLKLSCFQNVVEHFWVLVVKKINKNSIEKWLHPNHQATNICWCFSSGWLVTVTVWITFTHTVVTEFLKQNAYYMRKKCMPYTWLITWSMNQSIIPLINRMCVQFGNIPIWMCEYLFNSFQCSM